MSKIILVHEQSRDRPHVLKFHHCHSNNSIMQILDMQRWCCQFGVKCYFDQKADKKYFALCLSPKQ